MPLSRYSYPRLLLFWKGSGGGSPTATTSLSILPFNNDCICSIPDLSLKIGKTKRVTNTNAVVKAPKAIAPLVKRFTDNPYLKILNFP